MRANHGSIAYWSCAGFTLISALVSAGFSILSLRMPTGHEYAMYAASRSVALPLAIFFVLVRKSRGGLVAIAVVMSLVQLFDAYIGLALHDPGRAYGPLALSVINAVSLFWMSSTPTTKGQGK